MNKDPSSFVEVLRDGSLGLCVTKTLDEPVGRIFENFELEVMPGEIVAILGASGCGKTTLLDLIAGLQNVDGQESKHVAGSRANLAYAFQSSQLVPWRKAIGNAYFEVDVRERDRASARGIVNQLLDCVQLSQFTSLYPSQLSAGMRQRLQLVRALAWGPRIVLLDEPLGAVDQPLRLSIAQALRQHLKSHRTTAIWVTHDSLEAVTVADRVLVIGARPAKIVCRHEVSRGSSLSGRPGSTTASMDKETQAANLRDSIPMLAPVEPVGRPFRRSPLKFSLGARLRRRLLPTLLVLTILAVWEALGVALPSVRFAISTPRVWIPTALAEIANGRLGQDSAATLGRAGLGFLLAVIGGTLIGTIAGTFSLVRDSIRPVLVGLTGIPLFVLAPAFILWFGTGDKMKVAMAALSSLPFVAYLVLDAATSAQGRFFHYLRATDVGHWAVTRYIVGPAVVAGIVQALRPGAVIALIGALLGEFVSAEHGLGYYIFLNASRYNSDHVMAGVAVLFICAMGVDALTSLVRSVMPGVSSRRVHAMIVPD